MHFFAGLFPQEARGLCRLGRSVPSVKLAEWCVDLLTALNSQTLQPRKNKLIFGINAVVQSLIAIGNALVPLFQNFNEIMEAFLLHQFILFPEFGELEGGKLPRAEEQTNVVVPERGFLGGYYVLEGSVHIILFLEHWLYDASDWLMGNHYVSEVIGESSEWLFIPAIASFIFTSSSSACCLSTKRANVSKSLYFRNYSVENTNPFEAKLQIALLKTLRVNSSSIKA